MTASDDFNRANGGLGANWTTQVGTAMAIASNVVVSGAAGEVETAFYTGTWANDQSSQATLSLSGSSQFGVIARASGTGGSANYYVYWTNGDVHSRVDKVVAGSLTNLANGWSVPATGSVMKIQVTGTTIEVFDDGVSIGTVTDSALGSGNPGIWLQDSGAGGSIDNWSAADVGGGGGGSTKPAYYYAMLRNY